MIMATVNLAACKIAAILFGLPRWQTLLFVGVLNAAFAAHSGLWGVLVIDMVQFFMKMTAVIAAAYFALHAPGVGGLSGMVSQLSQLPGPNGINYLNVLPDFTNNWDIAVAVFIMPIAVQWWSVWYPGAEPGGGSYIAQRMLASKSERDSLGAVLFFSSPTTCCGPGRGSSSALCSIIVYPQLSDIQKAFPNLDPALLGHDIAYPAMLKFLPAGFVGLMVGGLVAANSSTILTHLNWGASYLVHDFYRRFIKTDATERHYVAAGRVATLLLFVFSSALRLRARLGEGRLRRHPPDRRGHRPAVSGALVLVARERVVRGRRDGELVPRVARAAGAREERRALQHPRGAAAHDRVHHGVLGRHRVSRAGDRS